MKIYPSILGADFDHLGDEISTIETGADGIHIDIMDGHFVPNLSFGLPVLRCIQSELPLDVHLMVSNPSERFDELIELGVNRIAFHVEVNESITDNISYLRKRGVEYVGLAIDHQTNVEKIFPYLEIIDYIIVMTVKAGFSGQSFIPENLEKVRGIKSQREDIEVMIDGGVNYDHALLARSYGVDSIAATSYVFRSQDRAGAIRAIQDIH